MHKEEFRLFYRITSYNVCYTKLLRGRLTAPLVFAGAICAQILERRGIYTGAHIYSVHNILDTSFDSINTTREMILDVRKKEFPVISDKKGEQMIKDIEKARESLDSLGGVVECCSINVPAGISYNFV